MYFRVLGPLEVNGAGGNIAPSAPKPRQVISLLTLRRNAVVRASELIDELWMERPPTSALTTLQTYVYKLRKMLASDGLDHLLTTRTGGYTLTLPDSAVDLHRFEQRAAEGRAALEGGSPARASEILAEALAIWRGPALVDVPAGSLLSAYVTRLEESRFRTLELRIEADLRLARHAELVGELKALAMTHPLHERVHSFLMLALDRCGRRHDALDVYQTLRSNLIDELGLEPSRDVQQLQQAVLASTSSYEPDLPVNVPVPQAPELRPAAKPAQVPGDIPDFVGRERIVDEVLDLFAGTENLSQSRTAAPLTVVTGMPGVGKTTLAVHLAHLLREQFEDGQLFADLCGSTASPCEPADVIAHFLRVLGVAEDIIPQALDERAKLLRSVTAGRALLVVLDDAASVSQVAPLLPGDARCGVLITSRRRLAGLTAVANVVLGPFDRSESVELLARVAGRHRLDEDEGAAEQLVYLGDGLPLALRCIGGRLAAMEHCSVAVLARQFGRSRQVLNELQFGHLDVRALYDSVYERIGTVAQGILGLVTVLPAEFTDETLADLLDWQVADVESALRDLVDQHLLRVFYDDGQMRYRVSQLTRTYARERLSSALLQRGTPPSVAGVR